MQVRKSSGQFFAVRHNLRGSVFQRLKLYIAVKLDGADFVKTIRLHFFSKFTFHKCIILIMGASIASILSTTTLGSASE